MFAPVPVSPHPPLGSTRASATYTLICDVGTYAYTGQDADFIYTPVQPVGPEESGVPGSRRGRKHGKKRETVLRMAEVLDRESTADFLKEQLRLRHPSSAFIEPEPIREAIDLAAQDKRETDMRAKAAEKQRLSNEERMKILMILAETV